MIKKIGIIALIIMAVIASTSITANGKPLTKKAGACVLLDVIASKEYVLHDDIPMHIVTQMYLNNQARNNGLDENMVFALIKIESGYRNVRSKTCDNGLMQINDINKAYLKEKLGITDLMDERQNIAAGCYMLGRLKKKYKTNHKALMAYHMGEAGAKRLWKKGIYKSKYSKKVMNEVRSLKEKQ